MLKSNWTKPELGFISISFNMNVRWFISISCIAEEAVWTDSE
jgi:hypothetical protein